MNGSLKMLINGGGAVVHIYYMYNNNNKQCFVFKIKH